MRGFVTCVVLLFVAFVALPLGALETNDWAWRFVAGGATVGPGAFSAEGRYYFPAEDRYLYALDSNGLMVWRTDLGRRATGGIAVLPDGTIVVVLARGRVVALNMDGRPVWQIDLEGDDLLAPVVFRNGVIVLTDETGFVGAWTHHGRQIWTAQLESPASAAPISLNDGRLIVPTRDASIEILRADGAYARRRYIGEVGTVLVADARMYLGSSAGRVVALSADGDPVWRADVGSAIRSLRVAASGDIYATADDGSLARVTPDGVVAWRVAPGSAQMLAVEAGREIVSVSTDGVVSALDRSGNVGWQMRLPESPTRVTHGSRDQLIFSTETWVTYAYDFALPSEGSWATSRGASHRAGGGGSGRPSADLYNRSAAYLTSWGLIRSGSQSDQVVTMSGLRSRALSEDLRGDYHWVLAVSEYVAGAPYLGPISRTGTPTVARRARSDAIATIGAIGDLRSVDMLLTLIQYEPDPVFQAEILRALGGLGAAVDADLASRLESEVRRNVARGPDDRLATAVVSFVLEADAFRGGYMDPRITDVLLLIASSNYSREVRASALDALRQIAGGSAP